jgi:hypothetical protein
MIRPPAIEAFLAELREALQEGPERRSRILAETEDHIEQAILRLQSKGLSLDESANQAIAAFGPAGEIARRFAEQRPRRKEEEMRIAFNRWAAAMAVLGLLAMTPALFFVSVSILKYTLGAPIPFDPLDVFRIAPFEFLEQLAPAVFVGGVGCAMVLNLLAMTDLRLRWAQGKLLSEMTFAPKRLNVTMAAAGALILATIFGYVLVENLAERRVGRAAVEPVQEAFVVTGLVKLNGPEGVERS